MKSKNMIPVGDVCKENRRRIFVENDCGPFFISDMEDISERLHTPFEDIFHDAIFDAAENPEQVWAAVVKADDIFIDTSFVGSSGELFNKIAKAAIENNIKGKRIFNLRPYNYIATDIGLDRELFRQIATLNDVYFMTGNYKFFEQIVYNK